MAQFTTKVEPCVGVLEILIIYILIYENFIDFCIINSHSAVLKNIVLVLIHNEIKQKKSEKIIIWIKYGYIVKYVYWSIVYIFFKFYSLLYFVKRYLVGLILF